MYRWKHLRQSSLLAEDSVALGLRSCSPLPVGAPLLPFPPTPPSWQCWEHSFLTQGARPPLLSSPGWEALTSRRTQAGSHRTVPRSERDPGPGGELNSPLQGEVKNRRLSQPARSGREAPLPGLLMDQMQNHRLCSVQAPVPARCRAAGPGGGKRLAKEGLARARTLTPTPGFMVPPLSGSL